MIERIIPFNPTLLIHVQNRPTRMELDIKYNCGTKYTYIYEVSFNLIKTGRGCALKQLDKLKKTF